MSATRILAELWEKGVELSVNEDKLRYRAPKGVITEELRASMGQHKAELMALLRKHSEALPQAPPLVRRARTDGQPLPLSFGQERLWFIDQLEPGNPAYNVTAVLQFIGNLNVGALERCFNEIVRRHEVLRTTFSMAEDQPVQVILPSCELKIPVLDLRSIPESGREEEARKLSIAEARRPFDLASGPLLRLSLLRMADEDFILLCAVHHIVSDGWSVGVLMREITALYDAFSRGEESPLPELPIQYADFACWQKEYLQGEILEKQLAYWTEHLDGAPPVLELPADRVRPAVQSYKGARHLFVIQQDLSDALARLSQQEDATFYMILLAAFKALLYRYSGQEDIVVGCPVAGRNRPEIELLNGLFLNTLALRTKLTGSPSFRTLIQRVRDVTFGAYAHQDLPFERLVEELKPERDLSHTPVFQVMFVFQNYQRNTIQIPGLTVNPIEVESGTTMFDLTLSMQRGLDGEMTGFFRYSTDLFDAASMETITEDFVALLRSVAANPEQPISQLPLLSEKKAAALSVNMNGRRRNSHFAKFEEAEIEQTLLKHFDRQVSEHGNRIAVKTKNYELSYDMLNRAANHVARTISSLTGRNEELIALLFAHDAPMIIGMLGALKSGKTYVAMDPSFPRERLDYILQDSHASLILCDNSYLSLAQELGKGGLRVINTSDLDFNIEVENISIETSPDAIACLLYSSGSTGKPKGTLQVHRNILHVVRNYTDLLEITPNDRLTLFSSYSHVAAQTDIYSCLLNGAALYPKDIKEEGTSDLAEWMRGESITIYHSIPTLYRYFLDTIGTGDELPELRAVVLGGEEVFESDFEVFKKHFNADAIFVNMYGSTEITSTLMYILDHQSQVNKNPIPVGYPAEGNQVILLNESGAQARVYGEIAIRSRYMPSGYWQRPKESAEVFLRDSGDGWLYRTGDLGRRLWDGSIVLLGRRDFQVKIRGFRIELGEIEAMLDNHPAVHERVVLARQDSSGEKRLVAYIVPTEDHDMTVEGLRDFLKEKLPSYMIPAVFVFMESFPTTPNGKVNRKELPAPDWAGLELDGTFVAPRTPLEEAVARVWGEVLKINRISIHDSFFDLGGHSLLAAQIIARLRKTFQVDLPLRLLFEEPTIAGVSKAIEQEQTSSSSKRSVPSITAIPRRPRLAK